jgi:predicted transcriptional regulator
MSNRVEELESKVKELQAAVNGLTEELVEAKERVRQLEDEVEVDVAAGRSQQVEQDAADNVDADGQVEEDKADDAKEGDDEEESSGSDIIVA